MDFQQIMLFILNFTFETFTTLYMFGFPLLILYIIYRIIKNLIHYNAKIKAEAENRRWEREREREKNAETKTE